MQGKKQSHMWFLCLDSDVRLSIWYYLCTAPFRIGHSNRGESPELRTFFSKLLRLSKLPIQIIFVFDGNQRPPIKRGTRVIDHEHFLYKGMISFIEAFGFAHFTVRSNVWSLSKDNYWHWLYETGTRRSWSRIGVDELLGHHWCRDHRRQWYILVRSCYCHQKVSSSKFSSISSL